LLLIVDQDTRAVGFRPRGKAGKKIKFSQAKGREMTRGKEKNN
jgi:hypothetical protein